MTARKIKCAVDGKPFTAVRPNAKYCSDRCRQTAHRKPAKVVGLPSRPPLKAPVSLVEVTRKRLEQSGRLQTELGALAMLAATRLDAIDLASGDAGLSALMKDYRATMAEAVKDADHGSNPLDQIRESAALKLIHGGA